LRPPRLDLADAVAEHVADGSCIWLGNFGAQLFVVGRELVAQGRRGLHVVISSGGLLLDELLQEGVVAEVTFSHCWSPVGPRPTRSFRRAWEEGSDTTWHELPLGALSAALAAAAAGVPFAPVAVSPASGYVADDWSSGRLAQVDSPFGKATVIAALAPDVAFVHAVAVDQRGNARIGAPVGEATSAVQAAARTIVVAEEIVPELTDEITIPGVLVDAIVASPGAVAPDGVIGHYPRDVEAYLREPV
jgi:glutaconate CoA-transferase subunit A